MTIENRPELQEDILIEEELKEPPKYKVLLHNDDYTTMDFVVDILMRVFHKSKEEAVAIMLNVHKKGVGVCGIYPAEIAETKVALVHKMARKKGFPLKCTMEEV
ncbi:ATP-dependent Clp protease adaptor ClpS [Desulfothermus naphthae]